VSKNISNFDEFVNENLPEKKVTKQDIKNDIFECLSKSDKKLTMLDISKQTGYKTDNVYVAIISIKEARSKKIGDILYWYINENQKDPVIKKSENVSKIDPLMENWLKNDDPKNRKVFRNDADYMQYKNSKIPVKKIKKSRKSNV